MCKVVTEKEIVEKLKNAGVDSDTIREDIENGLVEAVNVFIEDMCHQDPDIISNSIYGWNYLIEIKRNDDKEIQVDYVYLP